MNMPNLYSKNVKTKQMILNIGCDGMKEKHKTLLLAIVISLVLIGFLVTSWFYTTRSAFVNDDEMLEMTQNILLIVSIGGFCSSTLFFYIVIDAWKKRKK